MEQIGRTHLYCAAPDPQFGERPNTSHNAVMNGSVQAVGVTAIAAGLLLVGSYPTEPSVTSAPAAATDSSNTREAAVAKLSKSRLAASVIFGCADSGDTTSQRRMAAAGVGGIVLLGSNPPRDLRSRLRQVQAAAPKNAAPIIASDEEGGFVQRLSPLIYPLPAAETMGSWSKSKLRTTAKKYGARMASLGVSMALAPVADLRVPGSYLDRANRAFSTSPDRTARAVNAWSKGLRKSSVVPVVKHWPGHGHAADTHEQAARVPSYSRLKQADLIPFQRFIAAQPTPAVMVAHVQSQGLTKPGVPASQSPRAISVLRADAGPDAVIMTDSLSMAAASSARGMSPAQAVVAALKAGVDWAMVCTSSIAPSVKAIKQALNRGTLTRDQLEAASSRIQQLREP